MAKQTIEERVEAIEARQSKIEERINGYGKIVVGFVSACAFIGYIFNWLVDKYIKMMSH